MLSAAICASGISQNCRWWHCLWHWKSTWMFNIQSGWFFTIMSNNQCWSRVPVLNSNAPGERALLWAIASSVGGPLHRLLVGHCIVCWWAIAPLLVGRCLVCWWAIAPPCHCLAGRLHLWWCLLHFLQRPCDMPTPTRRRAHDTKLGGPMFIFHDLYIIIYFSPLASLSLPVPF